LKRKRKRNGKKIGLKSDRKKKPMRIKSKKTLSQAKTNAIKRIRTQFERLKIIGGEIKNYL